MFSTTSASSPARLGIVDQIAKPRTQLSAAIDAIGQAGRTAADVEVTGKEHAHEWDVGDE